jgi:hypothetical protein
VIYWINLDLHGKRDFVFFIRNDEGRKKKTSNSLAHLLAETERKPKASPRVRTRADEARQLRGGAHVQPHEPRHAAGWAFGYYQTRRDEIQSQLQLLRLDS